jgi:prepilin-type N-terminal cleavage/methylation domain-containing protein
MISCDPAKLIRRKGGFTLIEMLLVVAIISLLTTIAVTAALAARDRANNSRIQAEISQVRIQAVSIKNDTDYFSGNPGLNDGLCDAANTLNDVGYPASLKLIEDDVKIRSGADVTCYASDDAYCARARMLPNGYYCVDSTGFAGTSLPDCDGVTFNCH